MLSPIAIFVYNRPDHLRNAIEALLSNPQAGESDLFVFSDAAKSKAPELVSSVAKVREYIHAIKGFKSVTVVEREKNFGLAASVIDGVGQLCRKYGQVIVIEDDLVVASGFLAYMNDALEHYRHEKKVMQISGHMFPVRTPSEASAFFLPFVTSWGWATWERAWQYFDPLASGYQVLEKNKRLRHRFDMNGAYPYFKMLEAQINKEIDSWAIRWNLSVFMNNGLVLYPGQSQVRNEGFDGTGVHCVSTKMEQSEISSNRLIKFPESLVIDAGCQQAIENYFKKNNRKRVQEKLSRVWGSFF